MRKQDFFDLAKEKGATYNYGFRKHNNDNEKDIQFMAEWRTGGVTGNSCWGSSNTPVDAELPQTIIPGFDDFLESIKPDLTFMQYRKIIAQCQKTDEYSDRSDYYGNYTNYAYIGVSCGKLFESLCDLFPNEFEVSELEPKKQNKLKNR